MAKVKANALKPFSLAGKEYLPGQVELQVTPEQIEKMVAKELIADPHFEGDENSAAATEAVSPEVVAELERQRDEAKSAAEAHQSDLQRVDQMLNSRSALDGLPDRYAQISRALSVAGQADSFESQLKTAQSDVKQLEDGIETVAQQLPPLAGLDRADGEGALGYLNRYAEHFKAMSVSPENEGATQNEGETPAQPAAKKGK
jgi:hypothetical protein